MVESNYFLAIVAYGIKKITIAVLTILDLFLPRATLCMFSWTDWKLLMKEENRNFQFFTLLLNKQFELILQFWIEYGLINRPGGKKLQ